MTSDTARVQEAMGEWAGKARKNAGLLLGFGVLTVVASVIAIGAPLASGLAITIFIGVALAIGCGARIIAALGADSFGQGALAFIGGLLGVLGGVILITRPGLGLATLTLLIGSYLLVDGIANAVLAFRLRPDRGWGSILFSGAVTALVAILLLAEWPISGAWALGTLVGVNLLFSGFAMISIGSAARRMIKTTAA